jgi:prepilin-type N-terminal cleavage/methylation domain-containing protein
MYTKPHINSNAFTLIELLSVMVILLVLAGISVPIISSARTSAKKGVTSAQISQLELALKQFESDFGVFPPDTYTTADTVISVGGISIPLDDDVGTGTKCLVFFLGSRFTFNPGLTNEEKYGPYIEFKKSQLEGTGVDFADDVFESITIEGVNGTREVFQLKDPFGKYYIYDSSSPSNNIASFDIYSYGADTTDDAGDPASDDITNW